MINLHELTNTAIHAAKLAGEEVLKVYASSKVDIEYKADESPLTIADKRSHEKIVSIIKSTGYPILSEEGASVPYKIRKHWEYYWLIDPLDGTKEFIKKNDEFTVNIALINEGKAVLGVVFAPVLGCLYYGNLIDGSFKVNNGGSPEKLKIIRSQEVITIVASRSHLSEETEKFLNTFPDASIINMGSSLKFMLIAEGRAQLYPRFSPTMEWDTAASQAIIEAAGGAVLMYPEYEPLLYNRENMKNGCFIVDTSYN